MVSQRGKRPRELMGVAQAVNLPWPGPVEGHVQWEPVREDASTQSGEQAPHATMRIIEMDARACPVRIPSEIFESADWMKVPDDVLIQIFGKLGIRDRVRLGCVSTAWGHISMAGALWEFLDMRPWPQMDFAMASSLAKRCRPSLRRLLFRSGPAAVAINDIEAQNLQELSGEFCQELTDGVLGVLVAQHKTLQVLQLYDLGKISADAIRMIGVCCGQLRILHLSGLFEVDGPGLDLLAQRCPHLHDLALTDCEVIDAVALGGISQLHYLSVAGSCIRWNNGPETWGRLTNLRGLDVSRTSIPLSSASTFINFPQVHVLCAIHCPLLEERSESLVIPKGKIVFAKFTKILDNFRSVAAMSGVMLQDCVHPSGSMQSSDPHTKTESGERASAPSRDVTAALQEGIQGVGRKYQSWIAQNPDSRATVRVAGGNGKKTAKEWAEWVLAFALLRVADRNEPAMDKFWLDQGTGILLALLKESMQEEVLERVSTTLATFVVVDDQDAVVDSERSEAVMKAGGVPLLLELAAFGSDGVRAESAKALANLAVNADLAKAVAASGGIEILAKMARSPNRWVAEEAAGALWNLSVGDEHKGAIAASGAVQALVELAARWPSGGEGVLLGSSAQGIEGMFKLQERAAGALANLAADENCSMEVVKYAGVRALVVLARSAKENGVQEQAARALANLAAHSEVMDNNITIGMEPGALEALVQLTKSPHEGVRQEAAGALWNLSFNEKNREAIAFVGGVEALVSLAHSCANGGRAVQERAAGALWGLSVTEVNSIVIGREGGIAPLVALARSQIEEVHETAAGALWNLAFTSENRARIMQEDGVAVLVSICTTSRSKMGRFMSSLALAYLYDSSIKGRIEKEAEGPESSKTTALSAIEAFISSFSNQSDLVAAAAAPQSLHGRGVLSQVADTARITEAGHLRCSGAELSRFMNMLRNATAELRSCAAFALLQFTMPGGRHAPHHAQILKDLPGTNRILRSAAAAAQAPLPAKVFARVVLRNLDMFSVSLASSL